MSWLAKLKKTKHRKIEKQSKLPKPPKYYNGSKSIKGIHKVTFLKASEIKD